MVYSISYVLKTSGRDYNSLIDAIKAYGVWWHQTESVWIIVTEENAPSVRDNLMKYIEFIEDIRANAVGYEKMTALHIQKRQGV